MATSQFPSNTTVDVATDGALSGDGSATSKLSVVVDDTTIQINGSNQLEVIAGGNPFDQDLNTDDSPSFEGLTLTETGLAMDSADLGSAATLTPTVPAGWAQSPAGTFTHTPGSANNLTFAANPAFVVGRQYRIAVELVSGSTGEDIAITAAGVTALEFADDDTPGTLVAFITATSTAGMTVVTPSPTDVVLRAFADQLAPTPLSVRWNLPFATTGTQNLRTAGMVGDDGTGYIYGQVGDDLAETWADIFRFGGASDDTQFDFFTGSLATEFAKDGDEVFMRVTNTSNTSESGVSFRLRTEGDNATGAARIEARLHAGGSDDVQIDLITMAGDEGATPTVTHGFAGGLGLFRDALSYDFDASVQAAGYKSADGTAGASGTAGGVTYKDGLAVSGLS